MVAGNKKIRKRSSFTKIRGYMDILKSKFIQEMIHIMNVMYNHGWNERNGGNISYLLSEEEVSKYLDTSKLIRDIPIKFNAKELIGKYFLVTGTGKYFKNITTAPEEILGIVKVNKTGNKLHLLWGFEHEGKPTSELPTHFMSHISRLKVDPKNRIIMHCHATHLISMSFSHSLDENELTKTLWEMCTECIVVFPDGVSTIPWIVPGTNEIGEATSKKMESSRLVVWPFHGIYAAGREIDETFGLIETAEKAAKVYTYMMAQGGKKQTITDKDLKDLADAFGVVPKNGILKV